MPQKLSPYKVSKMMELYFEGYSQSQIANKLKINQATVSIHVSKFKSLVEQQGIKAAGEEFSIMDQVEVLHSLAVELKKAKLTAEEAKVGLKMALLLQQLGIKQEDYKDLIQACTKMKSEGFITSAVKLNKLENDTGMTHKEIVAQAASTYEQLKKAQQDLQTVTGKLNVSKEELASIEKQKKSATEDLEEHMKQVALDMNRLKMVEELAVALKEAGIPDKELEGYIHRQQLLNQAGIDLDRFAQILEKAKVLTHYDGGKELLQNLSKYGGLTETIKALHIKVKLLEKQTYGLEQQAKLKGKIETEIAKLKVEKATLESVVGELHTRKKELDQLEGEIASLAPQKAALEEDAAELKAYTHLLTADIAAKEEKVGNLRELEAKQDKALASISEIENKAAFQTGKLKILESFLGLIQSSSTTELEKFAQVLPHLISEAKQGKYSPDLLRGVTLKNLTGGSLQVLKCISCGARFTVDKPPKLTGYECPSCGASYGVEVDQDELKILKTALMQETPQVIVVQRISPVQQSKAEDKQA